LATAVNATVNIDGWSTAQMASWYGTTATTNLRKVHVIDVEDLSEDSHTMEYLAGEHVLSVIY
jgi:hypothetical protein